MTRTAIRQMGGGTMSARVLRVTLVTFVLATLSMTPAVVRADLQVAPGAQTADRSSILKDLQLLDDIVKHFEKIASGWRGVIQGFAENIFYAATSFSLFFILRDLVLRRADAAEVAIELTRWAFSSGLSWWFLTNAPEIAHWLFTLMNNLGASAAKLPKTITPTSLLQVGFDYLRNGIATMPTGLLAMEAHGLVFLTCATGAIIFLGLTSINLMILLILGWFYATAGQLFIGFGATMFTKDMAVNYIRGILGLGVRMFVTIIVVGGFISFLTQYFRLLNASAAGATYAGSVSYVAHIMFLLVTIFMFVASTALPSSLGNIASSGSPWSKEGLGLGQAAVISTITAQVFKQTAQWIGQAGEQALGGSSDVNGKNGNSDRDSGAKTRPVSPRRFSNAASGADSKRPGSAPLGRVMGSFRPPRR